MFELYYIKNTANDKIYIGQTTAGINKRWKQHKEAARKKKSKLYRAMRKYKIENFSIHKICSCKDIDELNMCEEFLISELRTAKNGYNTMLGGLNFTRYDVDGVPINIKRMIPRYIKILTGEDQFGHFKTLFGLIKSLDMLPDKPLGEKVEIQKQEIDKSVKKIMNMLRNGYPSERMDVLAIIFKSLCTTKDFSTKEQLNVEETLI